MIVIYLKENNQYIMKIDGFPELKEQGNKLYVGDKVVINDLTKAGYKEYPEQRIVIPTKWDEEPESGEPIPQTLAELKLRDFTAEDLLEKQKLSRDLYQEVDEIKQALVLAGIKKVSRV